ncbi:MAG TPA: DUF1080 domain-containing protein [Planctomycetaceae bacterium]|nr:DUF1080 domain-containing protein [Planctomycetaceae bacterium]
MSKIVLWIATALALAHTGSLYAADNELTPAEKAAGWQLLFNGHDHTGWRCNNGSPVASPIEDGALTTQHTGGYLIVYEKEFDDFVLKCDVKMEPVCNSGIFFRVGNLHDPVQTGFEVQVANEVGTGYHDFAAIYDLVPPKKFDKPLSPEWNSITVRCKGPRIDVEVNGQHVAELNCDEWTRPHYSPDGRRNKFAMAIKDFPRKGYLGFQDHGHKVWFKNVKLLDLAGK